MSLFIVFIYLNPLLIILYYYTSHPMDIEYQTSLSPKSRAILYYLKKTLASKNINFNAHICNIFQFQKTKFNRKQFHKIILHYNNKLVLKEIDQLFDQLDDNRNQLVFYESIWSGLENITEEDNPEQELNRKSRIFMGVNSNEKQNQIAALIQVKDLLLQTQDYLEVITIFAIEKDGLLTKQNVIEILRNFDYNNLQKQNTVIKSVFESKNKIQIKQLLQKLGLDKICTRIIMPSSPLKEEKSQILEDQESDYIKNQKKSKLKQPDIIKSEQNFLRESVSNRYSVMENSLHFNIQNIPSTLQPYFNYGSELDQPFATFASEFVSKNIIYVDQQNPTCAKCPRWVHLMEVNPNYQLFSVAKSILFRDKNRKGLGQMLQPKDIIQGGFGDCYFLSAVAAIVQDYPQLVYRLFVLEKNPSHIFGVKLFIDGIWRTIPLDACFPFNRGVFYGAQPHHKSTWVMFLEKAWAKVYKSYENIHAGYNNEGLLAISGAPSISISSRKQGFLRKVMAQFGKGSIITCATSHDVYQLTEREQQNLGVFAGHAYTLLKIYQNLPYKGSVVTLFKIRNPWGGKGWKGDWSFNSPTWTRQLKQKLDYLVDPHDGTFFVGLADFVVYFDYINISKVNLAFRHSFVTNNSSRFDFYQNRFKIKTKGDYFFTLYQENGRKYKNMSVIYEKSNSWLFLAKINVLSNRNQIKDLTAIACRSQVMQNNTIQTTLEPGEYVLISKVSWKYWNQHDYTITSYGPDKVLFTASNKIEDELLNLFITSRAQEIAKHEGGSTSVYQNTNIIKRYDFSMEDGVGFITIHNLDFREFQTSIFMEPCRGLYPIAPHNLPFKVNVIPYECKTIGFIINPQGFRYNMREKYFFK